MRRLSLNKGINDEKLCPGGTFTNTENGFQFRSNGSTGNFQARMKTDWVEPTTHTPAFNAYHVTVHRPGYEPRTYHQIMREHKNPKLAYVPLEAHIIPRNQPIAREDHITVMLKSEKILDALANDESSYGAAARGEAGMRSLELVDAQGKTVRQYSDDYGTYRVVKLPDGRMGLPSRLNLSRDSLPL